jgi:hypothetical protein
MMTDHFKSSNRLEQIFSFYSLLAKNLNLNNKCSLYVMAIQVVEFSNGGYKIIKVFA